MGRNRTVSATHAVHGALVAAGLAFSGSAYAQGNLDAQWQALEVITNTADRICNVVTTRGETESSEIQGNIRAQLTGLAARLSDTGLSGTGRITSTQYQNVLQNELAVTLRNNAECKLRVFETLHRTLLGQSPSGEPALATTRPSEPPVDRALPPSGNPSRAAFDPHQPRPYTSRDGGQSRCFVGDGCFGPPPGGWSWQ